MRSTYIIMLFCLAGFGTWGQTQDFSWYQSDQPFETRANQLVSAMTTEEKISQLSSDSPAIPRLGIPEYNWWNEALHGIARNGKATIFPQAIGLAATFDPVLAERVATAISTEARAKFNVSQSIDNRGKYAGLTFWTPNVNIFRDPRWGRGQETYGEDPYLTAKMGVAFVQGLQGDDPKYLKSAACAKHYAVHSGPEALRHHFDVSPSPKDLYETYLPAFEALVREADVKGVMGAYNAVYGDPSCSSEFLLKELLRDQWGFDGYVVSDCGALGDIMRGHKKVATLEEAAALALKAGVNLNCGYTYGSLAQALDQGLIDESLIDQRLKQLYMIRFELGLFDTADTNPYANYSADHIHSDAHVALAKEVAQKSIVLLKNKEEVLPLDRNMKNLYVTGPFAASVDVLMGNYYGISSNMVTVLEGVADKVSPGTSLNYRMGAMAFQPDINPLNWAPNVAAQTEAVVCVLGISADMEGEEVDAIASPDKGDRKNLKLPQNQIDYFLKLAEKKIGPLILVIASGSPVSLEGLEEHADAILQMWYPGEQGGNALADVLFGEVSPSGHLPITFPKNIEQLPAYDSYDMAGRTYKYMTAEPMYPFGFGLSYSSIDFSTPVANLKKIKEGQELKISIDVANTGDRDIEEVIQVYLLPKDKTKGLPMYTLLDFQRVALAAQSKQRLTLSFDSEDFDYVGADGKTTWVKGQYEIKVANALPSSRSLALGAKAAETVKIQLH
ncbi:glycoside hydrolase family 3 C-terminal domain-containing protein [Reichenbachiella carrageenanivorans]|uniref:Glycoside hydrolase family 3 C-terminal domain-containing protein n=1 Tax=Reichenbachiella carrageenanivorans TaxID=2979869 RepID=A0ABY6CYJ8_9BACT|nr:glycoside hydrolase family 3 C-terminal domain-containing protein [Reichenbachiella carrageenanivorans]UXX77853.1 glycoside hydrolase family 3 C-terminal domain-containing protein [Reichenbachiella carrageenanivorans]